MSGDLTSNEHATFLRRYLLRKGCEVAQTEDEQRLFDVILFLESLASEPSKECLDYITALQVVDLVFAGYNRDQPKWWKRMDGTPILNDLPVRIAKAFADMKLAVTKVDPLFCCEKYQNLVCNGACKEVSGNPSPVAVCNSAVESGSPDGAINASRCEGPADEKTVRNEACLGDGIPCATDGAGGCVACDDGKGNYRPSGKKPAIPCVWRDGCRAPEVCAAKGHCDAPTLQQNEAWKAGETSARLGNDPRIKLRQDRCPHGVHEHNHCNRCD